jgi:hypothetical protein
MKSGTDGRKHAMNRAFAIGDRVTVINATTTFYTRNHAFICGKTGVIVEHRPDWVVPEDEAIAVVAWNRSTSCGSTKKTCGPTTPDPTPTRWTPRLHKDGCNPQGKIA